MAVLLIPRRRMSRECEGEDDGSWREVVWQVAPVGVGGCLTLLVYHTYARIMYT